MLDINVDGVMLSLVFSVFETVNQCVTFESTSDLWVMLRNQCGRGYCGTAAPTGDDCSSRLHSVPLLWDR